jgi:hypothetical protein
MANVMAFEIWEGSKKLDDGPNNVQVTPGTLRTVTLKAKGYKEKIVTLDGVKKKLTIKLDHIPGAVTHPNVTQPPPGHPDCSKTIVDPRDKVCQSQYCNAHQDEPRCNVE